MKELSIEEKAKRYDEIIKKANKMHSENCEACQICIEELIPELAESKDERIRKRIIHALHGDVLEMSEIKEAVDWLEKQGEQKAWSEEDEKNLDWLMTVCERIHYKSDPQVAPDSALMLKDWLRSIKDRCTWKPSNEQMDALHYVTNFDYGGHKATLVSLYEQLKKLKE